MLYVALSVRFVHTNTVAFLPGNSFDSQGNWLALSALTVPWPTLVPPVEVEMKPTTQKSLETAEDNKDCKGKAGE